jgi:competence protein ComGD
MKKSKGFSLFELLIVLAVIAVVSVILTPGILGWRSNASLRGAAGNLKADLELCKAKAVRERSPVTVTFQTTHYQVTFTDKDGNVQTLRNRELPGGVRVDLDSTNFTSLGDQTVFNGRGLPQAGSAVLVNNSGQQKRIIVSPLGRIRIE